MKFFGNVLIWTGLYVIYQSTFGAHGGIDAGTLVVSIVFALPLFMIGKVLVAKGERSVQIKSDAAAKHLLHSNESQNSSYFLYLRPFDSTNAFKTAENPAHNLFSPEVWERDDFHDLERVLSQAMTPTGKFVAFGRPGEHLGAGRIFIPDEGWMEHVSRLAEHATLIFVLPSTNRGTMAELRLIKEKRMLSKTIFIMPPTEHSAFQNVGSQWQASWEQMQTACRAMGLPMPDFDASGRLFMISEQEKVDSCPLPGTVPSDWTGAVDALLKA